MLPKLPCCSNASNAANSTSPLDHPRLRAASSMQRSSSASTIKTVTPVTADIIARLLSLICTICYFVRNPAFLRRCLSLPPYCTLLPEAERFIAPPRVCTIGGYGVSICPRIAKADRWLGTAPYLAALVGSANFACAPFSMPMLFM